MLSDAQLMDLMNRTRTGDQEASRQLVEEYEPEIRRAARLRLTNPKLRSIIDSIDICQSVFGRFFESASNGKFDFERPEQLLVLLLTMTRNRVIDVHRRQAAAKRVGTLVGEQLDPSALVADSPGPQTSAAARELLTEVRNRLSPEELAIADRRGLGKSWDEIAVELDQPAEGLRKRLERALKRVREELGG